MPGRSEVGRPRGSRHLDGAADVARGEPRGRELGRHERREILRLPATGEASKAISRRTRSARARVDRDDARAGAREPSTKATCAGRLRSSTPIRVPGPEAARHRLAGGSEPFQVRQRPSNSSAGAEGSRASTAAMRSPSPADAPVIQRILGGRCTGAFRFTSAMPIGFPTRV
jgi:hypothetical protein